LGAVHGVFNGPSQTCPNVGAFTVANSLNQKIPEGSSFELQLAQNIKHLTAERSSRFFQFL
jgi:hypothetical protein